MASFKDIAQSKGVAFSSDKGAAKETLITPKKRMKRPWYSDEECGQSMPKETKAEATQTRSLEDAWLNAKKKMNVIKNSQPKIW